MSMDTPLQVSQSRAIPLLSRWWMQISIILLIIVELSWILPWFNMVTQIADTAPLWLTGVVLGSIMLMSYIIVNLLVGFRIVRSIQLTLLGALLVVLLLIAQRLLLPRALGSMSESLIGLNPGRVIILFFVIWMYWRGISMAKSGMHPGMVWRRFEVGVLFLMAYIIIASRIGYIVPSFFAFIVFFIAGLLSVVISRVAYVGYVKGVQKNPFDLAWLISVGSVIGGIVLLSAIVGGLISGQFRPLLHSLIEIGRFFAAVIIFIIGIPGLLISIFVFPLIPWLKNLVSSNFAISLPEFLIPASNSDGYIGNEVQYPSVNLQAAIFWALILILVVFLVSRLRQINKSGSSFESEDAESLLGDGDARRLILKNIHQGLQQFTARLSQIRPHPVISRVRMIYQQLMIRSAELNKPRSPQMTPLEYLPELGELYPQQMDGLMKITRSYHLVRYGELPDVSMNLAEVESAWKIINTESLKMKRSFVRQLITTDKTKVERESV
jgi:hypothetical protein